MKLLVLHVLSFYPSDRNADKLLLTHFSSADEGDLLENGETRSWEELRLLDTLTEHSHLSILNCLLASWIIT